MITWFVAWLTLDERRVEQKRNGLAPCITHQSYQPTTKFGDNITNKVLDLYTTLLTSTFFRISVVGFCLIFLGFGVYGWISIKNVFYVLKMVPSDSYLTKQRNLLLEEYPNDGWVIDVYSGEIKANDLENIDQLVKGLKKLQIENTFIKGKSRSF